MAARSTPWVSCPIAHQVDWPRIGKAYAAMDDHERKAANDGLNAWLRTMRGNYKALCASGQPRTTTPWSS